MKKFLFSDFYFAAKVIGFDLDGTIYDEFEFIFQVYKSIVNKLIYKNKQQQKEILNFMLNRWLEKGSSFPYIFQEAQHQFGLHDNFEAFALNIFRNFQPKLRLTPRIRFVLEKIKTDGKKTFLLTDGNKVLQQQKINSLKITDYFNFIIFTGIHPKPSPLYRQKIIDFFHCSPDEVCYIGDREVDKQFSVNCGFVFVNYKSLLR